MPATPLRSTLAHSPLLRLLGEGTPTDAEAPGMDFAERLGVGLGAVDAIRLQSALQALRQSPAQPAPRRMGPRPDLGQDLRGARALLAEAIAQDPLALAKARLALPDAPGADAVYAVFQERHLELQGRMELAITPLRAHARETLARRSPALRQLAALDAAMGEVLAPREQAVLRKLPGLLKKRCQALQRRHAEDDSGGADWPDAFAADWRRALLAELDLRLAPTAALVAALESDDSP